MNSDFSDIASAMTDSVAADGQTPITGALQGVAGSSIAPGWTFHADTTSGLYSAAVGELGIVAAAFGMLVNSNAFAVSAASPASAGSGYAVGDTIVIAGGTGVLRAILTVATLSGSGVATATVLVGGNYSTAPTSPASQFSTSGSGTGATFTLTTVAADEISDLNGAALWTEFGATSYMAGSMAQPNGLGLANYIGSANLAAAVLSSLPVPTPQGRLTPITNATILAADAIASSQIFYTPLIGVWNPIHNGSIIIPIQLSGQLTLQLTSSQAASNIYDIFLAYNAGTPVIGTGPSWLAGSGGSVTAGSCARGTGAGGTALTRLNGVIVNTATISLTWNTGSGNNTLSVAANQGVYLGSIFIDSTQGQVTCHTSYGQSRKWGVWNNYNQINLLLQGGDPTSTWTYNTATWRPSNNNAANSMTQFTGLAVSNIVPTFSQQIFAEGAQVSSAGPNGNNGIGLNWVSGVPAGVQGTSQMFYAIGSGTIQAGIQITTEAKNPIIPNIGINTLTALEIGGGVSSATFNGTSSKMLLSCQWGG